ncbi:MAG: hypothetical protein H6926_08730 [Chromatiales bacterium]|nr:hypothetical protein [Gammaproteobacteria bacterium]MCP5353252.1 hypothetical protein [Chromatiales bacterium]
MTTFDELNTQNHEILELSRVLNYLISDRLICDTCTAKDVFFNYMESVRKHLEQEDKEIYRPLLTKGDKEARLVADRFMSGSHEIKRMVDAHMKRWTRPGQRELKIADHDGFINETQELTRLMEDRIVDEAEKLYPTIRRVNGNSVHAH